MLVDATMEEAWQQSRATAFNSRALGPTKRGPGPLGSAGLVTALPRRARLLPLVSLANPGTAPHPLESCMDHHQSRLPTVILFVCSSTTSLAILTLDYNKLHANREPSAAR